MLIEDPAEFRRLCAEIYDEFRPMSTTEGDLVEQMAVYRWKMARMEALISSSALQSTLMHMAFKDPVEFKTERGTILMPDMADQNEQGIHRMLYQLEQQQGRIQKAYFTALKTLERLQARRPRPVTVNLESQTASTEIVRTAGAAGGGLEVTSQDRKPAGSVRRL